MKSLLIMVTLSILSLNSIQVLAQSDSDDGCKAICVYTTGEVHSDITWTGRDWLYKLQNGTNPFRVVSESFDGLKSLCPDGVLLASYDSRVYYPEQMTPNQIVSQGYYIKNPTPYNGDSCMETIRDPRMSSTRYSR